MSEAAAAVCLRPRTEADLPACVDALRTVHDADGYPMHWPADPAGWLQPPGSTAAWLATRADRSQHVIGHLCTVTGIDDPQVQAHTGLERAQFAWVSRLFVAPVARGRGLRLGTALLAAARAWSAERGLQLVLDVVDDDGPAVELYERLGWQQVARRAADWTTPTGDTVYERIYLAPLHRRAAPPPPE